jgi:hypothetical protein
MLNHCGQGKNRDRYKGTDDKAFPKISYMMPGMFIMYAGFMRFMFTRGYCMMMFVMIHFHIAVYSVAEQAGLRFVFTGQRLFYGL